MLALIIALIMHTRVSSGAFTGAYVQITPTVCVGVDLGEPGIFGNALGLGGDCK